MAEQEIMYRLDRIEAEAHELDLKVDGVLVGVARMEERQTTLAEAVGAIRASLEARLIEDKRRGSNDRTAMITASAGILVALISALALLLSTGALG